MGDGKKVIKNLGDFSAFYFPNKMYILTLVGRHWDSPTPYLASECAPPPGARSPAGEGLGKSQFRRLEKKLNTHPTLWAINFLLVPRKHTEQAILVWIYQKILPNYDNCHCCS